MSTQQAPVLGSCPFCNADIASYNVLIEYEDSDGEPAVYAECPQCRDVVNPE